MNKYDNKTAVIPAKIAPPRLGKYYARRRLFTLLDRRRKQGVVWLHAPAGSGKTTLVASYLRARGLPSLWYQLDEGDADIGSFFHYLGLAAKQGSPRRKALPALTPEYLMGVRTFARNFFRDLCAGMKLPGVIVLDNYQIVPEGSILHDSIQAGLSELPTGVSAIIVSRSEPPAEYARLRASDALSLVGWDEVRLTPAESAGIARLRAGDRKLDKHALEALHERTQGWVSGLVLLLGRTLNLAGPHALGYGSTHEAIFDYFATEIFENTSQETQNVLLKTAVVPQVSARLAGELTGNDEAAELLATLARENYFIYRLAGNDAVYQYHPLFREFLLSRGKRRWMPEEWLKTYRLAANILVRSGLYEDALSLMAAGGDTDSLCVLVETQAGLLVSRGRVQTLSNWLSAVPEAVRTTRPWLSYWLGVCRFQIDPAESRLHLERAFAIFSQTSDLTGIYLSWCGIVDTYIYIWHDFILPLDRWIAILDDLLARHSDFPSPEIEARVTFTMFIALFYRQPHREDFPDWAKRATRMWDAMPDAQMRAMVGQQLIMYHVWCDTDLAAARTILSQLAPVARSSDATPLTQIAWHIANFFYSAAIGDNRTAIENAEAGIEISAKAGVHVLDDMLRCWQILAVISINDLEKAREIAHSISHVLNSPSPLSVSLYHTSLSQLAFHEGDFVLAREHILPPIVWHEKAGMSIGETHNHLVAVHVFSALNDEASAARHLAKAYEAGCNMRSPIYRDFLCPLSEAAIALKMGDTGKVVELLRHAFKTGHERQIYMVVWVKREQVSELCRIALEHNVEVDYVKELIRRFDLAPAQVTHGSLEWPWPIKIHTLGKLQIMKDGKPVVFRGKVQRRPLDLLMALIAFGARDVAASQICDALWPDAEGDAGEEALEITLRRLRTLLGDADTIVLQNGRLSLNRSRIWVDIDSFEALTNQQNEASLELILSLYRGCFLDREADVPWVWSARERLRSKFLRYISQAGESLIRTQHHEDAVTLLEKALDSDDLAEQLYCLLMRAHGALGQRNHALSVYRRCERILANTLGIAPSAETQALHRSLQLA